jgi:hypothetical protein
MYQLQDGNIVEMDDNNIAWWHNATSGVVVNYNHSDDDFGSDFEPLTCSFTSGLLECVDTENPQQNSFQTCLGSGSSDSSLVLGGDPNSSDKLRTRQSSACTSMDLVAVCGLP